MINLVLTVFLLIGGFLFVTSTILLSNEQNDQYVREQLKMCIIAALVTIVGCLVCLFWNYTVRYSECSEDSFTEMCVEQNVRP